MTDTPDALLPQPDALERDLAASLPQFSHVQWVSSTTSTNADLLEKARNPQGAMARPWLLGAHLQQRGRGRAGRTWQNRAGANLMFSCAFDVFLPAPLLPTLSPLTGLTACLALRGLLMPGHRADLTMKWPNDLQWKFAKLAGILVETTRAGTARLSNDHYVVIIGIGLNLNDARALSLSLDRRIADWSEIRQADGQARRLPIAALVTSLAKAWYAELNQATARQSFDGLPERYAQVDALAGQHVNLLDNGQLLQAGIACGIDNRGQLLVRTVDGEIPVNVGEVSVRPRIPGP
ncbi:MAG: biotin--[acetyl-CoA-carboxylase] ligase [Candidimonas sp.]